MSEENLSSVEPQATRTPRPPIFTRKETKLIPSCSKPPKQCADLAVAENKIVNSHVDRASDSTISF